jgi:hypothetical protein
VVGNDGRRAEDLGSPTPAPAWTSGPRDADLAVPRVAARPSSASANSRPRMAAALLQGACGGTGASAASWRSPDFAPSTGSSAGRRAFAPLHRIPRVDGGGGPSAGPAQGCGGKGDRRKGMSTSLFLDPPSTLPSRSSAVLAPPRGHLLPPLGAVASRAARPSKERPPPPSPESGGLQGAEA